MKSLLAKLFSIFNKINRFWTILGIVLIPIILFELSAQVFLLIYETNAEPVSRFERCYENVAWVKKLHQEETAVRYQWHPYIYWRGQPVKGEFVNIDERGLRQTRNKSNTEIDAPRKIKIFMFGGSTMWGTGARDGYTIPSHLATLLTKTNGLAVEVTNFGQGGYVSTQEHIALLRELQSGNIPDLVIFYDGVNDVLSAIQMHRAGQPNNEINRFREFNLLYEFRKGDLYRAAALRFINDLATMRILRAIYRKLAPSRLPQDVVSKLNSELMNDVLQQYIFNLERINALGKEFGFQVLFYWQPIVFTKDTLSLYEKAEAQNTVENYHFTGFYLETYKTVRNSSQLANMANFHNISDIFDRHSETIFIDFCHVVEDGNKIIAERMAEEVSSVLKIKY